MDFINFGGKQLKTVLKALEFAEQKIEDHYAAIAEPIAIRDRYPIWEEMHEVIRPIEDAYDFFRKYCKRIHIRMDDNTFIYLMDAIRSSLEIYRLYLEETCNTTGIKGYREKLIDVDDVSSLSGPRMGRKDAFLRYVVKEEKSSKEVSIFISYQDKDVERACRIRKLLIQSSSQLRESDVFVAHRDIPLTEEWRGKIIAQLNGSSHLFALCTNNYICSAFGNQEVGYAMAKGVKIVSLFWEDAIIQRYGFLESFQALPHPVNDDNLEDSIKLILRKLGRV